MLHTNQLNKSQSGRSLEIPRQKIKCSHETHRTPTLLSEKVESVVVGRRSLLVQSCGWANASVNAACFLLLATAPALTDATILDRHAPLGAAAKVLRGQTLKHNRFVSSRAALHWHSCASRPAALPRLWCHHHTSIMKGSILAGVSSVKLEKQPQDVGQNGREQEGEQNKGEGLQQRKS